MGSRRENPVGLKFGRFLLLPHRRELLAGDQPVKLGGRSFDVLMALIDARGAVLSKDALMERVWSGRIIEQNALQSQIWALRCALGADRDLVRTVSGRGYQFTGEILVVPASEDGHVPEPMAGSGELLVSEPLHRDQVPTNLPEPVSELIGRDDVLSEVLNLAAANRLVTLTGSGGIGKTRLALAAARELMSQFPDGVWLVELSPVADPVLVPATVAAAIGVETGPGEVSAQRVAVALSDRQLLVVLDTCEHVIGAAAAVAEALLRVGRAVRVLATSREPLGAEGEWIYPVPPLAVPSEDVATQDELLRYGAAQLFVQRARAANPRFVPDPSNVAKIGAICRRIDGIPLAIEMAAARTSTLGTAEIAARLDNRFQLLLGRRRTAVLRHQTLRATLDWSYELLPEPERVILRRLGIFAGPFTLDAVGAIAASPPDLEPWQVIEGVSILVAKSLVMAEAAGAGIRFRLLDTTPAYATEKLAESGEREAVAHRHAEYYRDVFEQAEAEWETRPAVAWLADYGHHIDDVRAALDWAFSPGGDASTGIALTVAAVPLWTDLSLIWECCRRVEQALASLASLSSPDARREMQLLASLGALRLLTGGATPEAESWWQRALDIAENLDDCDYRLRTLWGLYIHHLTSGHYREALAFAERFNGFARARPADAVEGERMIGNALHRLGDQAGARPHLERALARDAALAYRRHLLRFPFDQRVAAYSSLARVLWLQGFPDQALRLAQSGVDLAKTVNPASLSFVLSVAACPVAIFRGDLAAADGFAAMLLDLANRSAIVPWNAWAAGFRGMLVVRQGDAAAGSRLLRTALGELSETGFHVQYTFFTAELASALGQAGEAVQGLNAIDQALAQSERNEEGWYLPELLRIKGELLLCQGGSEAATQAEDLFRRAIDCARRQGALSWELRAATSIARLLRDQGRSADALALLQPVYDRFTEGFDTADLKAAKALLDALR